MSPVTGTAQSELGARVPRDLNIRSLVGVKVLVCCVRGAKVTPVSRIEAGILNAGETYLALVGHGFENTAWWTR